jgi:L-asparagine transporter-like permease
MLVYKFGIIDYVLGVIQLTVLIGLLLIGLVMIYRGIKNQKI